MNSFLRIAAYIFHPILMPLFGVLMYYNLTPKYIEPEIIKNRLLAVIIISILIPISSFFLLKNLRLVKSIALFNVKERKFPLMIQTILFLLIIRLVFSIYETPDLYFFFVGILLSTIVALILVLFKFKISLHQIGIAGVTMFLIALSVFYSKNYLPEIAMLFFANGWVASSRLNTKSHSLLEIITGFFVGFLPQLFVLSLWL